MFSSVLQQPYVYLSIFHFELSFYPLVHVQVVSMFKFWSLFHDNTYLSHKVLNSKFALIIEEKHTGIRKMVFATDTCTQRLNLKLAQQYDISQNHICLC